MHAFYNRINDTPHKKLQPKLVGDLFWDFFTLKIYIHWNQPIFFTSFGKLLNMPHALNYDILFKKKINEVRGLVKSGTDLLVKSSLKRTCTLLAVILATFLILTACNRNDDYSSERATAIAA